jgi:hypothetical protein
MVAVDLLRLLEDFLKWGAFCNNFIIIPSNKKNTDEARRTDIEGG